MSTSMLPFATCTACQRVMNGSGCTITVRVIDGRSLQRLPYTILFDGMADNCHDCNAPVGAPHHPGCDQDHCPVAGCNRQAAFCDHYDQGWPPGFVAWP